MNLKIMNIEKQPSKYGGYFYYIYFRNEDDGRSLKTCVAENYRNYKNWKSIIQTFDKSKKTVITNIRIKNGLVDADSKPIIVGKEKDNQINIFDLV